MKGTRHSEEQIIAILKQGEAGLTTAELCRQHGITEQTYYRWKAKYGGMDSSETKKLKNRMAGLLVLPRTNLLCFSCIPKPSAGTLCIPRLLETFFRPQ
jgi:Transposase